MQLSEIATEVFDAVTAELDAVIKTIALERTVKGAYDPATGAHTETTEDQAGRGLAETENLFYRIRNDFPEYIVTGKETLWFIAEVTNPPLPNDKMTVDGKTFNVVAVRDILQTGELFRLLVI